MSFKKAALDLQEPEFLAQVIAELIFRTQTLESQVDTLMNGFFSMQKQLKEQKKLMQALETLVNSGR